MNIFALASLDSKDLNGRDLKDQITQIRLKISDCWSLVNITPFIVKIKGAFDASS